MLSINKFLDHSYRKSEKFIDKMHKLSYNLNMALIGKSINNTNESESGMVEADDKRLLRRTPRSYLAELKVG